MTIPTEPIGSIPRPARLIEAFARVACDDLVWSHCTNMRSATRLKILSQRVLQSSPMAKKGSITISARIGWTGVQHSSGWFQASFRQPCPPLATPSVRPFSIQTLSGQFPRFRKTVRTCASETGCHFNLSVKSDFPSGPLILDCCRLR